MICVSLPGPSFNDLINQVAKSEKIADLIEFRLDLYDDPEIIRKIKTDLPFILTCRPIDHGGSFKGSEKKRLSILASFFDLSPEYVDIEDFVPLDFTKNIPPTIKIIRSYHNFDRIPSDFSHLFRKPADLYKIACMANTTHDALRLLEFVKNCNKPLAALAMGEKGAFTRILGKVFGSHITYASLSDDQATAPGQITVKELKSIYHLDTVNKNTKLYGLIGDPIEQSIGHIYHNSYMYKQNALYVKMQIAPNELETCLELAIRLGFLGFSVTIPHKETIIPLLNEIDENAKKIKAVNTIKIVNGKTFGTNTDAKAAIDPIGDVKDKKVALIGAGGAARAIAYEANIRGASVVIFNRSPERAKKLAKDLSCRWASLLELTHFPYDIIINSTSNQMPITVDQIRPNKVAMDISISPKETEFLKQAALKDCSIVFGKEMFTIQAKEQSNIWFSS